MHPDPMFFFGTLMDEDVLAAVLGHPLAALDFQPARLTGWRRVSVAGRSYPMLAPHATGWADGVLVRGLDERDRCRLNHYEGPEYRMGTVTVRTDDQQELPAGTYLCRPGVVACGREEWRLDTWRMRHKRAALARIRLLMAGWRG